MGYFAPSFPNDDSFFCRFFLEVGAYKDAADRYLHEVDFRAEEQPESFKSCPFHDSRKGYLMNYAALRQITAEWPQIKQGMSFFAALYPAQTADERNLTRAWRITLATMFAPVFLAHRADQPCRNGTLPTMMSGLFKIMLDVPTTIDLMLQDGGYDDVTGADAMVAVRDFADAKKILLNTDYVCAGSPKLMDDINGPMFLAGAGAANDTPAADVSAWTDLFPDAGALKSFVYLMAVQYAISQMYQISTMIAMEAAFKAAAAAGQAIPFASDEREDKLSAYERRRRFTLAAAQERGRGAAAVDLYFNMTADAADWGVDGDAPSALARCHDASHDFLRAVEGKDAAEIRDAYESYAGQMAAEIKGLQGVIAASLGAPTLFPPHVRFGNDVEKHPAQILKEGLRYAASHAKLA